jgi:hypothetical protein
VTSTQQSGRSDVLDIDGLRQALSSTAPAYRSAAPFPHIIFEDFLNPAIVKSAIGEFPDVASDEWKAYAHVNERKFSNTDPESWGSTLQSILAVLNSDEFVAFVGDLTGIEGLFADPGLEGGGLHQSTRDGYLNMHADFTVHPHHQNWRRQVNLLVYFNEDWDSDWGGELELWEKDMSGCVERIAPIANRAVIFTTDMDSFHGHPEPMTCPEGTARRSLALYYFNIDEDAVVRSTEYRARPGDGAHGIAIFADKQILRIYDWSKRRLGVSDELAHKVLAFVDRFRRKR